MASPPPAPGGSGPTSAGGDAIALGAQFIKDHYFEIFLGAILIYIGYYGIIAGSRYIFKPAYLVDPRRGTKRYIGRALYSKMILGNTGYQEFRSFIKDGFFRPIIPHLFADVDRVKILSNALLLDFRSVVYDHNRRMFVGSLTGVKDMDLDGLSVEERVKDKLQLVDVTVSMAVRGSPSISQYSMMHNAIPLPDNYYKEDIKQLRGRGLRQHPSPDIDDIDDTREDHVEDVIRLKKLRIVRKGRPIPVSKSGPRPVPRPGLRPVPRIGDGKRFAVGPSEEHDEDLEWVETSMEEVQEEVQQEEVQEEEGTPSNIVDMESTSVIEKIKKIVPSSEPPSEVEQDHSEVD